MRNERIEDLLHGLLRESVSDTDCLSRVVCVVVLLCTGRPDEEFLMIGGQNEGTFVTMLGTCRDRTAI